MAFIKNWGFVCFLLLLMGVACQPNRSQKVDDRKDTVIVSLTAQEILYNEVMQIHDEVMPAMLDIMSLTKKIKAAQNAGAEESEKITELTSRLENAGEDMMNWMRNFNPNLEDMTPGETLGYLEGEKEKIKSVKIEMEAAIETARKFIQNRAEVQSAEGM